MSVLSVAVYAKDKYDFVELSKDYREYQEQYKEMRASLIIQHAPELLGEYATYPVLQSRDEKGIREFQRQIEVRQDDIVNKTERYKELLTTLAIRH